MNEAQKCKLIASQYNEINYLFEEYKAKIEIAAKQGVLEYSLREPNKYFLSKKEQKLKILEMFEAEGFTVFINEDAFSAVPSFFGWATISWK